jgi:hypothetical protein
MAMPPDTFALPVMRMEGAVSAIDDAASVLTEPPLETTILLSSLVVARVMDSLAASWTISICADRLPLRDPNSKPA